MNNLLQNEVCRIPNSSKHLLVELFYSTDLLVDTVCYMVNNLKKVSDTICYQNLLGHGIQLSENGATIQIHLDELEKDCRVFMFGLSIFEPQVKLSSIGSKGDSFLNVEDIMIKITDEDTQQAICSFVPKNCKETTALYLGNLSKTYSGWSFKATEEYLNGNIVELRDAITDTQHLENIFSKK